MSSVIYMVHPITMSSHILFPIARTGAIFFYTAHIPNLKKVASMLMSNYPLILCRSHIEFLAASFVSLVPIVTLHSSDSMHNR
jgi:hypothetical protein